MKRYRYLIFDVDNTLLNFDRSEESALESTLRKYFTEKDREKATEAFHRINGGLWDQLARGILKTSASIKTQRFQLLTEEIPAAQGSVEQISDFYLNQLSEHIFMEEGVKELLPELKSMGCEMSLLTNGIHKVQEKKWHRSGLKDFFPLMVTSEEAGVSKPDPEVFDILLERWGNPPREQVLMIGDSLKSDIAGATAAGLGSCWYNPLENPPEEGIQPDKEIRHWKELPSLLES